MAVSKSQECSTGLNGKAAIPGVCALLAVVVALVFCQTIRHEFVDYDDGQYFFTNPHVETGLTWNNVLWAFQTTYASNWHPLTWLSLMLDVELFGSGPSGPHLMNVLLHAANTVLLFLLLRRLMGLRSDKSVGATTTQAGAHWRSAFVAALFGLHPLHVESVAWASERKDVLSGLFFMLTLLMYARYAQGVTSGTWPAFAALRRGKRVTRTEAVAPAPDTSRVTRHAPLFYGLALLFFALGLMSKPMLVTLPFVLLLLDYWPLRRFEPSTLNSDESRAGSQPSTILRLALEKLPFLALSVASSAVTFVAQKDAVQPFDRIPMGIRAVNAMVSCVRYLSKMFWPVDLAIPYPYPGHWSFELFWLSAAIFLAAIVFVVWLGRRFPFLITGWFWYLGMLVPVIGLVQVGAQSMADRYTYLPLIGVFILLVWGAGEILESWRLPKRAIWSMAMLILAACTARTLDQLRFWQNTETLFHHTIAVTKGNAVAYYNLGEYYSGKGRLDEAVDDYLKAIQIRPGYDDALNNLGVALALKGELDKAVARIRESIHYQPEKADAYYNLGNVFIMQHKLDEAVSAYTEALRLKPDYPEAHNNLANVLLTQGHWDAAVQHYREALRLNPGHEGAKRQLRALGAQIP
jgi:cytochrome c-type biogenesis protein CcmH/NrfG